MNWSRAAIFAALFFLSAASVASAQDVTLTSRDGKVEIAGTLLGFDGEFYRVETKFGELTIDGSGVLCDGPGCPSLTNYVAEVIFSGSSVMAESLLPALVESFAHENGLTASRTELAEARYQYELSDAETGVVVGRFIFLASNTDQGFTDLLSNQADMVLASREIRTEERNRAYDAGMGDMTGRNRARVLALDAMVPVVALDNPLDRISTPELAQVFAGEITNWADIGGPDAPIVLHLSANGSGLAQAVEDRLLGPVKLTLDDNITRHARSSVMVQGVADDPFAIGIARFAEAGKARALTLTGECGFSLQADRRSIKTEDYPLNSPMFLYLPVRRLPKLAREFLAYTSGPQAQLEIRRVGFVDQTPEHIGLDTQGDRLANAIRIAGEEVPLEELQRMVDLMEPMQRLTTSFRFETGSTRPDAQSRSNVSQLALALGGGRYDGKQLIFVGFSDGQGPASGNQRIALKRAKSVRNAVLKLTDTADLGQVRITVDAFGEAMPMACDDSDWGRQVNRRVEVWVR